MSVEIVKFEKFLMLMFESIGEKVKVDLNRNVLKLVVDEFFGVY